MATPTLALIPTGYKAGKLYSVLPESGVGDFTVVRATEATRVNQEGLIETMGANVPRLDYSGGGCPVLLTEPQRTNLITQSQSFSNWQKSSTNIVTSDVISPSGQSDAKKIITNNATNQSYASFTATVTSGATYTFSVFAKKGEVRFICLVGLNPVTFSYFDLELGVKGTSTVTSKMEDYGNGWYRCSATFTADTTSKFCGIYLTPTDGSLSASSIPNGNGNYIFGASLEQGSYATSLIKTSGSAVTRNGDIVNGAGDAATFNDSEGVLMVDIAAIYKSSAGYDNVSITDGSASNMVQLYFTPTINQLYYIIKATTNQAVGFITLNDATSFNKIAIKYKANDFALWSNGYELLTDTSGSTPIGLNTLNFDSGTGSSNFYGKTSQVQYFNTVLTDSELETLTSWTSFIEMAQAQNYNII